MVEYAYDLNKKFMFKKIVSTAPFNPKMAYQLRFYANRLHQEESLRKLGVIFTALAVVLQMFAVFVPAKSTRATSPNNLIYGASSKQTVLSALKSGRDTYGRADIREIFDYYGITTANVEASTATTVKSRERSYITTGRGHSSGLDTAVQIPGTSSTIYERSLNVWDVVNYENCYNAITGKASGLGLLNGKIFWILLGNCGTTNSGCGNITFETLPKTPSPEIIKTAVGNGTFKPNENISYRINYRNKGQAAINNVSITDTLAEGFEYVSYSSNASLAFKRSGQQLTWTTPNLQPSQTWHEITLTLKTKPISTNKKKVCNNAELSGSNGVRASTANPDSERCITIDNACPGSNLPIPDGDVLKCVITCSDGTKVTYDNPNNCPAPEAVCESLKITGKPSWNKRTYEAKILLTRGASLTKAVIIIDNKEVKDFGQITKSGILTYTHEYQEPGNNIVRFTATPKSNTKINVGPSCEIEDSIVARNAIISLRKNVENLTQKIADSNNKTARGGDELEYVLSVSNNGTANAENYVIDSDNLNDVLEYADLTTYNDAIYDKINQRLTWAAVTVPANGSIVKKFTVKIKNPVPSTPPALSDRTSYDYKIRNVFGNEVAVNLDKPIAGATYQAVSYLPNTGPGSSFILSVLGLIVIGFFYARNRLLSKEIDIVKNELVEGA